jgi:hypothetical protein
MKATKKQQIKELRNEMYAHIIGLNKFSTVEFLNGLSDKALIGRTHPLYREEWQSKFNNLKT